jgi:hypothetical protein
MRPGSQERTGEQDLFRARLDQIINMRHELVRLAQPTRPAPTTFESWLPMDSEARKKSNCNARDSKLVEFF